MPKLLGVIKVGFWWTEQRIIIPNSSPSPEIIFKLASWAVKSKKDVRPRETKQV